MYYEQTIAKLQDMEARESQQAIKEQMERQKAISEAVDYNDIWNRLASRKDAGMTLGEFRKNLNDAFVVEGLTVFIDNCVDNTIIREEANQQLVRQLVSNFVKEEGSMKLLDKFQRTSNLLSEMAYIINQTVESILEKADPKNSETFKIENKDKDEFYGKLAKVDAESAITTIKNRVQEQQADFINDNVREKAALAESLAKTEAKVKEKTDDIKGKMTKAEDKAEEAQKVEEAYIAAGKRRATDIRSSRTKNILEHMVLNLSRASFVNEAAKEAFVEDSKLNMDKIVEHCEVLCTFVTALDSIKLINLDENYIRTMLNDMKG